MIPISDPRSGKPSEPPDTPRSAGSRAPGEKRPPLGGTPRPWPSKTAGAEPPGGKEETTPPSPAKPAVGGAPDEKKEAVPQGPAKPAESPAFGAKKEARKPWPAKPAAEEPARERKADPGLGDEVVAADEFDDLLMSLRAALEEEDESAGADVSGVSSKEAASELRRALAGEISTEFNFPDWLSGIDAEGDEPPAAVKGPEPPPALEVPTGQNRPPAPETAPRRRYIYRSYESTRVGAHKLGCRVTLACGGRDYTGLAEGASIPGIRAEIAARATLDAVANAEDGRVVLSLMAARVLRFVDLPLVVVSVYGMNGDELKRLVGAAPVDNSEEQAAILATLQATDRWLAACALGY